MAGSIRARRPGGSKLRRGVALGLAAAAAAFVLAAATASATVTRPPGDAYVALGDSYSSGEGLAPFLPGDAADPASCDRSASQAYPELLGGRLALALPSADFLACSGARTTDLVAGQLMPGGITTGTLGPATRLVTLTIGGNDLDFVPALTACVNGGLLLRLAGVIPHVCSYYQVRAALLLLALASDDAGGQPIAGVWGIPWILRQIHAAAPNATIALGGYPHVFPPAATSCEAGSIALWPGAIVPVSFSADVVTQFNAMTDLLNATLAAVVARAAHLMPVVFVDVAPRFAGHEVSCTGTQGPGNWINSVTTAVTSGSIDYAHPAPSSFHPSAAGQRAYADAFADALAG